jgi:hypothetical protein
VEWVALVGGLVALVGGLDLLLGSIRNYQSSLFLELTLYVRQTHFPEIVLFCCSELRLRRVHHWIDLLSAGYIAPKIQYWMVPLPLQSYFQSGIAFRFCISHTGTVFPPMEGADTVQVVGETCTDTNH